jgi:small subunit ribosomal protein S9
MADEDRVEPPETGDGEQKDTEASAGAGAPQGADAEGAQPEPSSDGDAEASPDAAAPDDAPAAAEADAAPEASSEADAAPEASSEAIEAGDPAAVTTEDAERVAASSPDTGGTAEVTPEAAEAADTATSERPQRRETAGEEGKAGESRSKPEIPGADLEPDIVIEEARRARELSEDEDPYAHLVEDDEGGESAEDAEAEQTIAQATIDLASGATYTATGKRKTAVARVILRPGTGEYRVNGRDLDVFFPRVTLRRAIRMPLETVGYETRMDVVAKLHGGGVSAQAIALRHGIARALIDADPNLRGDLKKRGFLTRDQRVKERKKAGLKKARKRPQFSKR